MVGGRLPFLLQSQRQTNGDTLAQYVWRQRRHVRFWYPSELPTPLPVILVGMRDHELERTRRIPDIGRMLVQPGPIREQRTATPDGKPLWRIYYRIAQGYLGKNP